MFEKKFTIIRKLIIFISILVLVLLQAYDLYINKKYITKELDETKIISETKKYIKDRNEYYSELKNNNIEIRVSIDDLVKNNYIEKDDSFNGYVSYYNKEYKYVNEKDLLINKIIDNNSLYKESNNEGFPFDINYLYKNEPYNYIKYNDSLYRIIGITNSNKIKVIDTNVTKLDKWGNGGSINYFSQKNENEIINGMFYVGYIRSENKDIELIIKSEKRNNNYTKSLPKYYGEYSYVNISDIINASNNCKINNILEINTNTCNSYLLDLLKDSYSSNTLEDNKVYYINEEGNVTGMTLTDNVNVHKVFYVEGLSKYISGNGEKDNPYIFE